MLSQFRLAAALFAFAILFGAIAFVSDSSSAQSLRSKRRAPANNEAADNKAQDDPEPSSRVAAKPLPATSADIEKNASTVAAPIADKPSAPAIEDPTLQEIMRLRQSMGSALTGSVLEKGNAFGANPNTAPEPSADELFAESLKRLSSEQSLAPAASRIPSTPAPLAELIPSKGTTTATEPNLVFSLRNSSRALDAKANDLEELRQYEEAERLRELSRQLRQEARRFDQPEAAVPSNVR